MVVVVVSVCLHPVALTSTPNNWSIHERHRVKYPVVYVQVIAEYPVAAYASTGCPTAPATKAIATTTLTSSQRQQQQHHHQQQQLHQPNNNNIKGINKSCVYFLLFLLPLLVHVSTASKRIRNSSSSQVNPLPLSPY